MEVEADRLPQKSVEALSVAERFEERVAMGLRLTSGLALEQVCRDAGQSFEQRRAFVEQLLREGLAVMDGPRLKLTDEGLDVHSAISARLM